jgi:hypothetical protein
MPLTTVDQGLLSTNAQYTGFKNRIINGDMTIDQRNNGASVAVTSELYTLDRWYFANTVSGKITCQQNAGSVTPPAGFTNYLGVTSASAYSVLTGDLFALKQSIEGFNTADLGWGTANAQTVTLGFWVRSSLTGTFGGSFVNSAFNRSYVFSYTINAANTWEYKTVTVPGDTTGTWVGATNGIGIRLYWDLGAGSTYRGGTVNTWNAGGLSGPTGTVSVVGTSGATFYITGVQLEKGSTATSFDVLPYGTELSLCQRYCIKYGGSKLYEHVGQGNAYNTSNVTFDITLPTTMRTTPSYTVSGNWVVSDGITNTSITGFGLSSGGAESSIYIIAAIAETAGGLAQFRPYVVFANNSLASSLIVSAEL